MKQYLTLSLFLFITCTFGQVDNRGVNLSNNSQTFSDNVKMVVVGVSKYQNVPSLNYAHTDAQAFYNFMISPTGGRVDTNNARILLNEKATAANIWTAVYWLLDATKAGETVIIYFAGHGDLERKTVSQPGFLLASDAPKVMYPAGGAIAVNMLQEFISTLVQTNKARVILISDACHSGKLAGGLEGVSNTSTALQAQWDNTIKILSSQPGELSQEGTKWNGGGGVFTYYLIKGLMGFADRNHDNKVTVQEIDMYLMDNVSKETNYLQNPSFSGDQMAVLTFVDTIALKKAKESEKNLTFNNTLLAQRGFEDQLSASLDSATARDYREFRYCIEHHYLVTDTSIVPYYTCAWDIYLKLKNNKNASPIINNVKYSLLAALQERYQIFMNYMINNNDFTEVLTYADTITRIMNKELEKTLLLVDSTYILYNHFKASVLSMKAWRAGFRRYKNLDEYLSLSDEALELEPDNAIHYFVKADLLSNLNKNDEAISYFEKVLEMSPRCSLASFAIGLHYMWNKDNNNAIKYFENTISIDSTYAYAYLNLIRIARKVKDETRAKTYSGLLEKINQQKSDVMSFLGQLSLDDGDKTKANFYFNKAIQIELQTPDVTNVVLKPYFLHNKYYNIACYYSLMEDKANALKYLEMSLQNGWIENKFKLNDFDHIKKDTDLDYIRNTKEFKELIEKYSKK
jgi:tetratricopeptide (TPR) repeat protein